MLLVWRNGSTVKVVKGVLLLVLVRVLVVVDILLAVLRVVMMEEKACTPPTAGDTAKKQHP